MTYRGGVNNDYLFKYIIIGDSGVGKSDILLRYAYQPTIWVEFTAKNIEIRNKAYRLLIWDTAEQENFRSINRSYYKNSACALVVYDISNRNSFKNIRAWIEECKNNSPKTILMVLVGNKENISEKRQVNLEEGQEFADKNGMLFYEACSKDGTYIDNIFYDTADKIAHYIDQGFYDLDKDTCGIIIGR